MLLCNETNFIPQLTGMSIFTMKEYSETNYKEKTMKIISTNHTLNDQVIMYEVAFYRQHPKNPDWTYKELTPYMDIVYCQRHYCFGLKESVEDLSRNIYMTRAQDALRKEEKMLQEIKQPPI